MANRLSEQVARRILQAAMAENRCANLIECLWDGGTATVDHSTGDLVLIEGRLLADLNEGAEDCGHDSLEGIDQAPFGPEKRWRCLMCGVIGVDTDFQRAGA